MNKMMNPEMEVVRFGAEDVIATSSLTMYLDNTGNNPSFTFIRTNGQGDSVLGTYGTYEGDDFDTTEVWAYNGIVTDRKMTGVNKNYRYGTDFPENALLIHDIFGISEGKPMGDMSAEHMATPGTFTFIWDGSNWIMSN